MTSSVRRRQFLRGAGGFALALPLLESLAPREARAQTVVTPRFVGMMTLHGGVWGENMYPGDAMAPETQQLFPGHVARYGTLAPEVSGGEARLSAVLRASSSLLTDRIASKMNVLRGLDVMFYLSHHTGGALGNYGRNDTEFDPAMVHLEYVPTIDQVMAYSPSFYGPSAPMRVRSMHVGSDFMGGMSWGYANPQDRSGPVQSVPVAQSSLALFNQIFVPDDGQSPAQRTLVVDRVHESYRRLRDGAFGAAARLSADDRRRLDDHMSRLDELERRILSVASCGELPTPGEEAGSPPGGYSLDLSDMRRFYQLYNDVIVAAFICGTSRVATYFSTEHWSSDPQFGGEAWHQEVAHRAAEPDGARQAVMVEAQREFFASVYLDLVNKLDVEEADGRTYLDNSLVYWTQESGPTTHDPLSMPIVAAGSAAGAFRTGHYVDYRNRDNLSLAHDYMPEYARHRPGLSYNQWLANVLGAMGVGPEEYARDGFVGYGWDHMDSFQSDPSDAWPSEVVDAASDPLPIVVA